MHCKLAIVIVTGCLPLFAWGEAENIKATEFPGRELPAGSTVVAPATNQAAVAVRLKVICRSGAVVILDNATLVERGRDKGSNPVALAGAPAPVVRLNMPDGGTVTIPWNEIERIVVGDRAAAQKVYPVEVTLKNDPQPKVGKTYGYDNTIVGQSPDGEFSIQLKDVKEAIALPSGAEK